MYDELVKRLRIHAKSYEDMFGQGESSVMMHEAANAIEELSKRIDRAVELYNRDIEKSAMYEALVGIAPQPPKEKA